MAPRAARARPSRDDIRRQRVLELRQSVTQLELALFQPLQLQLIGLSGVAQRVDGGVEVAVFFAQPLQLTRQNRAFLVVQFFLRHARFARIGRAPRGRRRGEYASAGGSSQGRRAVAGRGARNP